MSKWQQDTFTMIHLANIKNFKKFFFFFQEIARGLQARGHKIANVDIAGSKVQGIQRKSGLIYANADYRKGGTVAGW